MVSAAWSANGVSRTERLVCFPIKKPMATPKATKTKRIAQTSWGLRARVTAAELPLIKVARIEDMAFLACAIVLSAPSK